MVDARAWGWGVTDAACGSCYPLAPCLTGRMALGVADPITARIKNEVELETSFSEIKCWVLQKTRPSWDLLLATQPTLEPIF